MIVFVAIGTSICCYCSNEIATAGPERLTDMFGCGKGASGGVECQSPRFVHGISGNVFESHSGAKVWVLLDNRAHGTYYIRKPGGKKGTHAYEIHNRRLCLRISQGRPADHPAST
jgi:hypothetical protein